MTKKGFTLIEAIIAIFVITVGIVAVLQLFPVSLQQRKMAEIGIFEFFVLG